MDTAIILRLIRRHVRLFITIVAVTLVAAVGFEKLSKPTYASSTKVLLIPNDTAEQIDQPTSYPPFDFDRYVSNQISVIESEPVYAQAASKLFVQPAVVKSSVSVRRLQVSDVVVITTTAKSPAMAAALAGAVTTAYLNVEKTTEQGQDQAKVNAISKQITQVTQQLANLRAQLAAQTAASPTGQQLTQEIDSQTGQYNTLLSDQNSLATSLQLATGSAEEIDPPSAPVNSSSVGVVKVAVGGLVLGMLLALLGAVITEQVSDRIHDPKELADLVPEASIVAELPREWHYGSGKWTPTETERLGALRDASRLLRAELSVRSPGASVILVTGPTQREDATVVGVALATAFAHVGTETVLVDAVLFDSAPAQLLGVPEPRRSVADCLRLFRAAGLVPLEATPVNHLEILGGKAIPDPDEIFSSPDAAAMIGKLSAENRLVIIVAPPVLLSPDTLSLAGLASLTVLLVGLNRTVRSQLVESISRLSGPGFPPLTVAIGK